MIMIMVAIIQIIIRVTAAMVEVMVGRVAEVEGTIAEVSILPTAVVKMNQSKKVLERILWNHRMMMYFVEEGVSRTITLETNYSVPLSSSINKTTCERIEAKRLRLGTRFIRKFNRTKDGSCSEYQDLLLPKTKTIIIILINGTTLARFEPLPRFVRP